MAEANPYQSPVADLERESDEQTFTLATSPISRAGSRGLAWIGEGFVYFKKSWGAWIGAMLLGFVILVIVSLIPFVGQLFDMATYYVWVAGLALGCRAQAQGLPFKVSHLWAGFTNHVGTLILLSLVITIAMFAIIWGTIALAFPQLLVDGGYAESSDPRVVLQMLLGMMLIVPVVMAAFFAPYLIVFHDVPLFRALKLSFIGCLKNIFPLSLWGIAMLLLALLALIPLGLGILVLIPLVNTSAYAAYEDIYLEN